MAFTMDEIWAYEGQLLCCPPNTVIPALGLADQKIKGSSYIQGPLNVGDTGFSYPPVATVLIGPRANGPTANLSGSICGASPSNLSLYVKGNTAIKASLFVSGDVSAKGNIVAQGEVKSRCGAHILSAKKNFDIPHPNKSGWRLRHTCLEGPSNDVYVRGRVLNRTEIELPEYWKDLVDQDTVSVSLTPIGSHQDVIVKRIDSEKVYLQAKGGMPINCFYHIFGERKDGESLIPEYEGQSPADYPGNNNEYSVSGYHYDKKEDQ